MDYQNAFDVIQHTWFHEIPQTCKMHPTTSTVSADYSRELADYHRDPNKQQTAQIQTKQNI